MSSGCKGKPLNVERAFSRVSVKVSHRTQYTLSHLRIYSGFVGSILLHLSGMMSHASSLRSVLLLQQLQQSRLSVALLTSHDKNNLSLKCTSASLYLLILLGKRCFLDYSKIVYNIHQTSYFLGLGLTSNS